MHLMRCALVLAHVLLAACATRPATLGDARPPVAVEIDALIRRGCYECLDAAFERSVEAGLSWHAFEAALLLAARSKELGLPHSGWIGAAERHLPPGGGWQEYLDIVVSLPLDPFSGDREALILEAARSRRPRDTLALWRAGLQTGPGSPVLRAYLDVSLVCGPFFHAEREATVDAVLGLHHDVPLLRYRAGICSQPQLLVELRQQGFVDGEFDLGRAALARARADQEEALEHFEAARRSFPTSPSIAVAAASLYEQREEWQQALEAYDAALELVPTHRDALLGRTVSLSNLGRHEDAIVSAAALIELGSWFVADAYYWRAWNHYRRGQIGEARLDVDRSRAAEASPATLVLSGVIAWREQRLSVAEAEFSAALERDFGYCEAAQNLAEVRAASRRWDESVGAFTHAEQCFALAIEVNRKAIDELSLTEADVRMNAHRIASHQRSIADAERRRVVVVERTAMVRRQSGGSR